MNQDDLIKKLLKTISGATEGFSTKVANDLSWDEIEAILKEIKTAGGKIEQSVENLKKIGELKLAIEKAIVNSSYADHVETFVTTFRAVSNIQSELFASIKADYRPGEIQKEFVKSAITSTKTSLLSTGLRVNVVDKLGDILTKNMASGNTYAGMIKQAKEEFSGTEKTPGLLERYVKTATTNTLNQFSRSYTNLVTADLGANWFMYTGPIIAGSRVFCRAMIKKKWFHISEIPDLIAGRFAEFEQMKGQIDPKTKLPEGMIPGTNIINFFTNCGGYACEHQIIAVSELIVPEDIKAKFK